MNSSAPPDLNRAPCFSKLQLYFRRKPAWLQQYWNCKLQLFDEMKSPHLPGIPAATAVSKTPNANSPSLSAS
jgi:hypothetical protein